MSYYKYYGSAKGKSRLTDFDVVLTTYDTLVAEGVGSRKKNGNDMIQSIDWYRVVLDEGNLDASSSSENNQD